MQNCRLHIDIFVYFLTLDKYYLPISSFCALRAACKRVRTIYTKQKYIEKYGKMVIAVENDNRRSAFINVAECYLLPNNRWHGLYLGHKFAERRFSEWLGNVDSRQKIAERYGLRNYLYFGTIEMRYYLGKTTGLTFHNQKLLGCEHIFRLTAKIDNDLEVLWTYLNQNADTPLDSCVELGCSMISDIAKFKKTEVCELGENRIQTLFTAEDLAA